MQNTRYWVASSALAIAIVHALPNAEGKERTAPVEFDLVAQPLASSLLAIGRKTGDQIIFPGEAMAGRMAPAIRGRYRTIEAVRRALANTGYIVEQRTDAIFIHLPASSVSSSASEDGDNVLVVTGSRIRGGNAASPVYRFETAKARDEGITDMHALAAAIPQNFNGGQNPGIGNGGEASGNFNSDSSTALNLRGLGSGSTLTLLNGHRLAYNLSNQSVDFSSIPFAAVERVEIMPDGASALYGSDAIGGVANIVLKSDVRDITVNAVVGAATDGGYFNQSYSAVGGTRWNSGNVVLTGSFDRSSDIVAGDRSFASTANPYLTLYPEIETYAFVASAKEEIAPDATFTLDAVYSHRDASRATPYTLSEPTEVSGVVASTASWNLSIAPSVTYKVASWELSLTGTYGRSHLANHSQIYPSRTSQAEIENQTVAGEFSGEGPLFSMPAGDVRLALGGGYRTDKLVARSASNPIRGRQENFFAFTELSVPLTAPSQEIAGFHRTALSAAIRYEDYPDIGRLATPKLGFIWSPTADADLKLSWGRSFKAPTLYQRINPTAVYLFPGNLYGERPDAPAGQTVLAIYGGKRDLQPEKAGTISASFTVHPRVVPGLEASFSYFNVNYRNRVVAPISSLNRVLVDPVFSDLVVFSPSATDIATTIALSPIGLEDYSGSTAPFDPASVFAIIDGRSQNVAKDKVEGVDFTLHYRLDAGGTGIFALHGTATYLRSKRILIAGTPSFDLAGTIYNPSHFRLRAGLSWSHDKLLINAVASHIGGVTDNRRLDLAEVRGMTSFDLSFKYRIDAVPKGLDIQFSALNLFNAKPDVIRGSGSTTPFDSTNYSSIGRYLSLSLVKSF